MRFTAYGKRRYVTLGAVSGAEAERQLHEVLTDVERGLWQPPQKFERSSEPAGAADFRALAEEWWSQTAPLVSAGTQRGYRWRLDGHLLPYFADLRLEQITSELVERYVAAKLSEQQPLSASSINMTLTQLGAILERAVERKLIAGNPARARGLRVPEPTPQRHHLENAAQIEVLLDGATELDHAAPRGARRLERRAMLATLIFAGLRIGELCALRWRDVDLASGRLAIEDGASESGARRVSIRAVLSDELRAVRARNPQAPPDGFVFASRRGSRQDARNFRARVLLPAIERANVILSERDRPLLPEWITLHSLRRTFLTVLCVLGEDPIVAMDEIGHVDPGLTLSVYRQAMRFAPGEKTRLRALVDGSKSQWFRGEAEIPAEVDRARGAPVSSDSA